MEYFCPIIIRLNLTLSQTTNSRLFQTERVCRRQFPNWWKWQKIFPTCRKHCGKRRNCSLRAISPFLTVFKRLVLQTRKNQGLFGKGLNSEKLWTNNIRCKKSFLCVEQWLQERKTHFKKVAIISNRKILTGAFNWIVRSSSVLTDKYLAVLSYLVYSQMLSYRKAQIPIFSQNEIWKVKTPSCL